ncbi:MAG: hypothetical protein Q7S45_04660 [Candidatus Curtissbacteria bacterium]|nr:hypothetical protein [Candidatus Curtissbacteria bacterium]
MSVDLMKRAEELDEMRSKHIAEKLTLEEAQNIVSIWGVHLEHSGGVRMLFDINIPESILPYPKGILQGALNKMEAYYYEQGLHDNVKLLEETEIMLIQYPSDDEAIKEALTKFSNKKWREARILTLKDYQETQMQNGYLVDKKLWKLSKSRIEELEK